MKSLNMLSIVACSVLCISAFAQQPDTPEPTAQPSISTEQVQPTPPIVEPAPIIWPYVPVKHAPTAAFLGWKPAYTVQAPAGCTAVEMARPHFDGKTRLIFRIDTPTGCKIEIKKPNDKGEWLSEKMIPIHMEKTVNLLAGKLLPNEPLDQIITSTQLIYWDKTGYKVIRRQQEVPWFMVVQNKNGTIQPMAAFPGGIWPAKTAKTTKPGIDWLSFSAATQVKLLDLHSATKDTDAVWAVNPLNMADIKESKLVEQGLPMLQARLNARFGGDGPLMFYRTDADGNRLILSQQSNSPDGNMMQLWQSEPIIGELKQIRLVRNGEFRDGLIIMVNEPTGTFVQIWVPQYEQ